MALYKGFIPTFARLCPYNIVVSFSNFDLYLVTCFPNALNQIFMQYFMHHGNRHELSLLNHIILRHHLQLVTQYLTRKSEFSLKPNLISSSDLFPLISMFSSAQRQLHNH